MRGLVFQGTVIVACILFLGLLGALVACDHALDATDNDGAIGNGEEEGEEEGGDVVTGELTYQGETTALTKLWFAPSDEGPEGSDTVFVYITSDGIELDFGSPDMGTGLAVILATFFESGENTVGTFNVANPCTLTVGTISGPNSHIAAVIDVETTEMANLIGGAVSIAIDDSTYLIEGEVTTDLGPAVFSYQGPLTGVIVPE